MSTEEKYKKFVEEQWEKNDKHRTKGRYWLTMFPTGPTKDDDGNHLEPMANWEVSVDTGVKNPHFKDNPLAANIHKTIAKLSGHDIAAREDAKMICCAVNSHMELLEASQKALKLLQESTAYNEAHGLTMDTVVELECAIKKGKQI